MPVSTYDYDDWAADVAAQRIVTGPYPRMAAERYWRMRERADKHPDRWRFNDTAVKEVIDWFPANLRIPTLRGMDAFHLAPFQQFILAHCYGLEAWDEEQEYWRRQTRFAYVTVARKSGKTTFGSGLSLWSAFGDSEMAPEVYLAAVDGKQARQALRYAQIMARQSPQLHWVDVHAHRIRSIPLEALIETVSKLVRQADGRLPHFVLADEFNQWDREELLDVLQSALRGRRQPLMFFISYAGQHRAWVGRSKWNYCARLLRQRIEHDAWFGLMFDVGQDEPDWDPATRDLYHEREWTKTNPGIGITVTKSALKAEALEAKQDPRKRPSYFRTTLCLWETTLSSFVQMDLWDRCGNVPVPDLSGRLAYGGCDLSKYGDLSAFVMVFPPLPGDPHWYVEAQAWIPGDTVIERTREEGAPYRRWVDESKIIATPGPVIDYDAIADHISVCAEVFDLREVAFDPKFAHDLTGTLMERHGTSFCSEFRQTFVEFAEPIVETERLYRTGLLAHGGDEVLGYCAGNVQVERDAQENPMLRKGRHDRFARIDSFVALCMSVGRAKRQGHGGAHSPPGRITF